MTPTERRRCCSNCRSFSRPIAAKPMPSMTTRSLRCTSVMSSQDSICGVIAAKVSGIVLAQEFERTVGEHHAEAEGGVGRVLLDDRNVGVRPPPLEQISEVKPGRPGAENGNAHDGVLPHCILMSPPKAGHREARGRYSAVKSDPGRQNSSYDTHARNQPRPRLPCPRRRRLGRRHVCRLCLPAAGRGRAGDAAAASAMAEFLRQVLSLGLGVGAAAARQRLLHAVHDIRRLSKARRSIST